jgi:glycosyltransferase involved in cell wall biosynthesis
VVFLCFGGVRVYKNIDVLLDAFTKLSHSRACLLVAGLPADKKTTRRLCAVAACDDRIRLRLARVSEDEVSDLFAAADVAVLPRGDGGTSGSLILAIGMGLPVIAAKMSANESITHGTDAAWLFASGSTESLLKCLIDALDPKVRREKTAAARRLTSTLGWTYADRIQAAKLIRGD